MQDSTPNKRNQMLNRASIDANMAMVFRNKDYDEYGDEFGDNDWNIGDNIMISNTNMV